MSDRKLNLHSSTPFSPNPTISKTLAIYSLQVRPEQKSSSCNWGSQCIDKVHVPFFPQTYWNSKKTYDIILSILQRDSYLSPIPKVVMGSHAHGNIIHHHPPGCTYGLPDFPQIISQMAPPTFAHFPHLIWSYPSFDNDRPLAVPQLGPPLQRRALAGIREGRRWGGVQPDCPPDGSVPGSDGGEGLRGVPVIRFRVIHWTVEQVEDGARTMERKYEATQRGGWGSGTTRLKTVLMLHFVIFTTCIISPVHS